MQLVYFIEFPRYIWFSALSDGFRAFIAILSIFAQVPTWRIGFVSIAVSLISLAITS